MKKLKEMH